MSNASLGERLFDIDNKIKSLKKTINSNFLELAKYLKEVRDNKLYEALDYSSFESYIAQPELSFDRSTVYRFIQIYEKLVLELNVAPGRLANTDWTKLREILPHVNEANKEELLTKAETLSRSDLKIETGSSPEYEHKKEDPKITMINVGAKESLSVYSCEELSYLELQRSLKRYVQFNPDSNFFALIMEKKTGGWKLEVQSDIPVMKKISQSKCPNEEEGHKGCIQFIDSLQEARGVKFPNYAKQIGALHKILKAGFTWEQINKQIDKMENNPFWKDKGFDIANIANELGKGGK